MHGSYHEMKGLGVDESVMWGEYFYLEAVNKALSHLNNSQTYTNSAKYGTKTEHKIRIGQI